MREIKFRAWLKNENKMAKVHSIHLNKKKVMVTYRTSYGASGNYSIDDGDFILQQYTGLKDKNGQEIYEGDIVEFCISEDGPETATVTFENGVFWAAYPLYEVAGKEYHCGVIGNIFEGVDK